MIEPTDLFDGCIHVHLTPAGYSSTGQQWDAVHEDGTLLATRKKDPEHAVCRTLVDMGYTGRVLFVVNGTPSSVHRAAVSAGYRVAEGNRLPPHRTKWYAMPGETDD